MLDINLKDGLVHFQLKPLVDVSFNLNPLNSGNNSLELYILNLLTLITINSKDEFVSSSYFSESHKGVLIEVEEHSRILLSFLKIDAIIRLCSTKKGFPGLYINVQLNDLAVHWSFPKAWS